MSLSVNELIDKDPYDFVRNIVFQVVEYFFNPASKKIDLNDELKWSSDFEDGPVDYAFEFLNSLFPDHYLDNSFVTLEETIAKITWYWNKKASERIFIQNDVLVFNQDPYGDNPNLIPVKNWAELVPYEPMVLDDKTWGTDFDIKNADDVERISNYTKIHGRLNIRNSSLETLKGLEHIESAKGLYIIGNQELQSIDALNIQKIKSSLAIIKNPEIVSINGWNNTKDIPWLTIEDNKKLAEISGFQNLEKTYHFGIESNPCLKKIDGFKKIKEVGMKLKITYNSKFDDSEMKELYGNKEHLNGKVRIESNKC